MGFPQNCWTPLTMAIMATIGDMRPNQAQGSFPTHVGNIVCTIFWCQMGWQFQYYNISSYIWFVTVGDKPKVMIILINCMLPSSSLNSVPLSFPLPCKSLKKYIFSFSLMASNFAIKSFLFFQLAKHCVFYRYWISFQPSQFHFFLHFSCLIKRSSSPTIKSFFKRLRLLLSSTFPWVGSGSLNHFNKTFNSTPVNSHGGLLFPKISFAALVRAMTVALTFFSFSDFSICSFLTGP